ncbi:MAG: sigma-70 family RNA polymerase sigma factor [Planctomycetota bacterium]|jgi:RNA polymerase sigma-70 factor (ECF subfamily)|nr:sigma-70 family RNA polymerase sigma factor [Planctomycetota bacterium]
MTTLATLVAQARLGNHQAFDDLVVATHRELRCFVSIRIRSLADADEIVQDVYVTCYEKITSYNPDNSFIGWLKGIAKNKLRERYRGSRLVSADQAFLDDLAHDEPPESDTSAALAAHLQTCLDKLPSKSRQLLDAMYHDGQSLKDMARRFKRKANNVAQAICRIRSGLRSCIEQQQTR